MSLEEGEIDEPVVIGSSVQSIVWMVAFKFFPSTMWATLCTPSNEQNAWIDGTSK